MARYKKYEHLPWWLNSMNDNTLRPTEKEALDTDYYCLPHGTKLSNQRTADIHHRSKRAIQLARRRLEELLLRTTEPAKGSFKLGHPIEYKNEAEWLAALRARGIDPRGAMIAPKSVKHTPPLGGVCAYQVTEASASEAAEAGVSHPQTPGGSTTCGSGEGGDSPATQKAITECLREVHYRGELRKLLDAGWEEEQAKRLAQTETDSYIAKRGARLKSGEEKRAEDQRNENPNLD
ncbi:hypothetical protein ES707_10125 [subsurface metagenome]